MTELTRRQLRELERSGQLGDRGLTPEPSATDGKVSEEPRASAPSSIPSAPPHQSHTVSAGDRPMKRRELRQREQMAQGTGQVSSMGRASALSKTIGAEEMVLPTVSKTAAPVERSAIASPPPVGQSRRSERTAPEPQGFEKPIEEMQAIDVEIPEHGLRGANYLGEPSTQAIVLESAPEAMSLAVDTGEIFTTGSIAILPDPTGSTTGALDGIDLDSEDAVTGVISIVDPVSAKDLIDQRSPLGVVPPNVLRKGWWRPWVIGALSILMAIAAILASITIFSSLGA